MKKVGILYGGKSTEHDASLKSRESIIKYLKSPDFELVMEVYVSRTGKIYIDNLEVTYADFIKQACDSGISFINLLHGQEGEDGEWSGFADITGLIGTFESTNTSSILMNKFQQSAVAKMGERNITIPKSYLIRDVEDFESVKFDNNEKIIIKPNSMGASHFVEVFSFPYDNIRIRELLGRIFEYDRFALVQEYIEGEEYTCGVINYKGERRVLPILHAKSKDSFLDHYSKHNHGRIICDFNSFSCENKLKEIVLKLFDLFDIKGMCRFDLIYGKDSKIYYLEGNLIPGFSNGSAFPMMLEKAGISMTDFLRELIVSYESVETINKYLEYHID